MSAPASSLVLRGVHVPAPRLPHLRRLPDAGRRRRAASPTPLVLRSPRPTPAPVSPRARVGFGSPAPAAPQVRLTRRGRCVIGLAMLAGVGVPVLSGRLTMTAGTPVPEIGSNSVERVAPEGAVGGGAGAAPWSAGSVEAERVAAGLAALPDGWTVVTAVPGDSLWAIAGRSAPRVDRRVVLARIVARNGLVGTEVTAGDALLVPTA